jgi:diguanylate cyclase (GGDEF)-like protein
MLFPRPTGVFLVLLLTCAATQTQASQHPPAPLRILTTAHAAHNLSTEEASRAYPIHLRAVVTYYDPYIDARQGALFVHDISGGIFIKLPARPILPLRPGSLVDIVGVSASGDFAPVVDRAQVKVVGESHVPGNAPAASMAGLLSGSLDGQWVEVQGIVRSVYLSDRNAILNVATTGGPVSATTSREPKTDYDALVDSLVTIHGNAAPVFNLKRQMVGVHLYFPSLNEVKVIQAAPPDPFELPVLSISHLLRFTPGLELVHRAHVHGRVTLQWPGRTLCIQNGNDGLCMQTVQPNTVPIGDMVDVVGFPAIWDYKPTLETATFHFAAGSAAPLPVRQVTPDEAFRGDHDGELVQIVGELIGQDRATGDLTLMLHSGRFLFPAVLPRTSAIPKILPWKEGSIVRLTGICNMQVDPETTNHGEGAIRPGSVRILLRSMADVEVLSAPSWWTQVHALSVLAAVLMVVVASFAWIFVLRRRVEQQTRALRSSEERLRHLSQHDALTSLPNRILLNDRLSMALKRAERFQTCVGLLMVDVDRFKDVNDLLGHLAGDQVLCEMARRIRAAVRETDTVARMGGDEFLVLLPDLHSPYDAQSIAAKIVAAISAPFVIGPNRVPVTASVGVCTCPEAGTEAEELLQNVDAAMYGVKAHGRNGFQVYRSQEVAAFRS